MLTKSLIRFQQTCHISKTFQPTKICSLVKSFCATLWNLTPKRTDIKSCVSLKFLWHKITDCCYCDLCSKCFLYKFVSKFYKVNYILRDLKWFSVRLITDCCRFQLRNIKFFQVSTIFKKLQMFENSPVPMIHYVAFWKIFSFDAQITTTAIGDFVSYKRNFRETQLLKSMRNCLGVKFQQNTKIFLRTLFTYVGPLQQSSPPGSNL